MDADDDLPILGEPLGIELANTWYAGGEVDFLGDPPAASRWLRAAIPGAPAALRASEAAGLRALRDAVRRLLAPERAGPPDPADVAVVNADAAAACAHAALEGGVAVVRYRGAPLACARAQLATSAIALVAAGDPVRSCEGPGCTLWFVPRHRHRRFCHESCSHRARQARYRSPR